MNLTLMRGSHVQYFHRKRASSLLPKLLREALEIFVLHYNLQDSQVPCSNFQVCGLFNTE